MLDQETLIKSSCKTLSREGYVGNLATHLQIGNVFNCYSIFCLGVLHVEDGSLKIDHVKNLFKNVYLFFKYVDQSQFKSIFLKNNNYIGKETGSFVLFCSVAY